MGYHDSNITIVLSLDAAPAPRIGFSQGLLIVPKATNPLGGARAISFANIGEAQAEYDDSQIDADTLAAATTAFSQNPKPASFMVGYVDLVALETYSQALAAIIEYSDTFYGVAIKARTDAEIVAVSASVEALNKVFFCQSDDSSLKDSGLPAGLTALATRERTFGEYHDEDDQWMDIGHMCSWLVYNPDTISAPTHIKVAGVDNYTTKLTSAQSNFVKGNNFNVGGAYGGAPFYIDPGKTTAGRDGDTIMTADWLQLRLQADIAELIVQHSSRGQKVTVSAAGQAKILALIKARLQQGVQVGHFLAGQTNVRALPITQDDLNANRLRFEGEATLATSCRLVSLNFAVGRNMVNVEA